MELLQTQANNLQELKLNINELLTTYNKLKNNKEILDILCGYLVQNPSLINFRYIEFLVPIPNIYLHLNNLNNDTYINELKSSHKDILPLQCLLELLKYNKLLCIVKNIETYIKRNDTNHKVLINAYYNYNIIYNIYEHYNHFNKLLLDSLISNHLIKNTFEEKFAILSLLLQLFKTSEYSNIKEEIVENYD